MVLINTIRGNQVGLICSESYSIDDDNIDKIREIKKLLNDEEKERIYTLDEKADKAYFECKKIVKEYLPEMNLVIGEYTFDEKKLIFYFTSSERLDFRDLVNKVNDYFNLRVEFYQIKKADEDKILNSFGKYGKEIYW